MRRLLIETAPNYDEGPRGCAGTDTPWYEDGEGFEISGEYDDSDAYPFGYFPVDPKTNELGFFISNDNAIIHNELFGQALEEYISRLILETFEPVDAQLGEKMNEFHDFVRQNGLIKRDKTIGFTVVSVFENENGDNRIIFKDVVARIFNELGIKIPVDDYLAMVVHEIFVKANWNLYNFSYEFNEYIYQDFYFYDSSDQELIAKLFGFDINAIFERSRLLGRIWLDTSLITFYPGQQPSRDEMKQVIKDIAENEGMAETEFYGFYTIFEVGSKKPYTGTGYKTHDDATIQCCTVADYIEGKYSGFNREAEIEMVKNRKGVDAFNVHLANQNVKKNFFKNFRNTRDKAVYAPREKAAGTLASYHAMRYPYGEEKETKGNLIKEYKRYNEAGTDHPYFKDENTGEIIEADWDDGEGFPFGYFPVKSDGELEFCVADYGETHAQACGVAAKLYFDDVTADMSYDVANEVYYSLTDFFEEFKNDGYTYNPDEDAYFSADGSSKLVWEDFVDKVMENIYSEFGDTYTVVVELVRDFLENGTEPSFEQVQEVLLHNVEDYEFYEKDDIDRALEVIGSDFDDFFEDGRLEGRIWPEKGLISFYLTEQPNPQELEDVIYDLADYMGVSYEYFMDFFIIYEDLDDGCIVKMCTVDEYINGPQEPDKQYARDGKTVFVPHLANQKDKFNFFKNFRNTRDKAVYAPREKTAGSLARYHAMRYPYGENRKRLLQIIDEEIKKILKKEPYK